MLSLQLIIVVDGFGCTGLFRAHTLFTFNGGGGGVVNIGRKYFTKLEVLKRRVCALSSVYEHDMYRKL